MKRDKLEKYYSEIGYFEYLNNLGLEPYRKYMGKIAEYTKKEGKFLDVGCGAGNTLQSIKKLGIHGFGLDVSSGSKKACIKKDIECKLYDGRIFPYRSNNFDCVGSYDVLEHTDYPIDFLNEKIRVLRKGGYLIVACPNFLSITNSYHSHTKGFFRKVKNLIEYCQLMNSSHVKFTKMKPIKRKNFMPDDDAVNATNPLVIKRWAKENGLIEYYWSSQIIYKKGIVNFLDRFLIRYFFGASFFVFKKQ